MEKTFIRHVSCENFQVAISCEATESIAADIYQPSTTIIYAETGNIHFLIGSQQYTVKEGHFGLLRKFTHVTTYKEFIGDDQYAKVYVLSMPNEFIRSVISEFEVTRHSAINQQRFFNLPATLELSQLMNAISHSVDNGLDLNNEQMMENTAFALKALSIEDPNLLDIFKEFSIVERADIEALIHHNYLYDIPLTELAKMSGRSLSTFNRDFRLLFATTPHQLIKRKRLEFAKRLMDKNHCGAAEVYLDAGFKDLSHFCKSFKAYFKQSASDYITSKK